MQSNTVSFLILGVLKDKMLANFLIDVFVCYFLRFSKEGARRPSPPPFSSSFFSRSARLGQPCALCEKKEKEKGGIIVVATELWPS